MTPEEAAALRRQITVQLTATLTGLFTNLGAWRAAEAALFLTQAVPLVQGAQRVLAGLVSALIADRATAATGRLVPPPPVPDADVLDLRGVAPAEVYTRPFRTVYTALAAGEPIDRAVQRGVTRLEQVAEMDMQQTYARTSRAAMKALPPEARPSGWRRVLIGSVNCALCVVASTQRYTIEDLNPIHPACDCEVDPVFGASDSVIEPELLERVHAAVESLTGEADRGARAPDYRQLLVSMTPEHGELGRMLVRPRDRFTTAAQLPS